MSGLSKVLVDVIIFDLISYGGEWSKQVVWGMGKFFQVAVICQSNNTNCETNVSEIANNNYVINIFRIKAMLTG